MDPTVVAAAISVGGAVIVGVVGFWSAKMASDQSAHVATDNTDRALDAARDERIWDRRARAYEQSVAALLYRRQQRSLVSDVLQVKWVVTDVGQGRREVPTTNRLLLAIGTNLSISAECR